MAAPRASSRRSRSGSTSPPPTSSDASSTGASTDDARVARSPLDLAASLRAVPVRRPLRHPLLLLPDLSAGPKRHAQLLQSGRPAQPEIRGPGQLPLHADRLPLLDR